MCELQENLTEKLRAMTVGQMIEIEGARLRTARKAIQDLKVSHRQRYSTKTYPGKLEVTRMEDFN